MSHSSLISGQIKEFSVTKLQKQREKGDEDDLKVDVSLDADDVTGEGCDVMAVMSWLCLHIALRLQRVMVL